jgi:hypothetical protein
MTQNKISKSNKPARGKGHLSRGKAAKDVARSGSKQDAVVAMLRQSKGVTIAAIMKEMATAVLKSAGPSGKSLSIIVAVPLAGEPTV